MLCKNLLRTFCHLRILLFLIIGCSAVNAQNIDKKQIVSKYAYAEKIYVQLSSTIFTYDETIWFKAIVTNAVSHTPTLLSGVLHVELIDFDKRIIDSKLLKLNKGIGEGAFQLNETLKPGRYLIRAYTNWNTNFGQDFISENYIDIYATKRLKQEEKVIRDVTLTEISPNEFELSATVFPKNLDPNFRGKLMLFLDTETKLDSIEIKKNKQGDYSFKYLLPKNTVLTKLKLDAVKFENFVTSYNKTLVIDKSFLDVQFFPEGGELINGLMSVVGFKALNYENKGVFISGTIIDQDENPVCSFKSNDLGMGYLYLKPEAGKTYFAVINNMGAKQKYPLPKAVSSGYVLTTKQNQDQIRIKIATNTIEDKDLILKVQSRGIEYYKEPLRCNNGEIEAVIRKQALPEGIIKLTVLDTEMNPICERLVFNYRKAQDFTIEAKANLSSYGQRDKAILELTTKRKDSSEVFANLSVLVLDKSQLGDMHEARPQIQSYFLLSSELRGTIEKPAIYFDTSNKKRQADIDALMLTQGWRNYKYNETVESLSALKIKPEHSITISGSIGELLNKRKKQVKPVELTLMTFGKPEAVAVKEVDSTGRFSFNLGDQYTNDLKYVIQTKNLKKDKNKTYTINIDETQPPEVIYTKAQSMHIIDSINKYVEKRIEIKNIEDAFNISSNTIALDEVNISGYKMTPEREKMKELHGLPDVVIEDKELHEKIEKWSYGLFSVLKFNYPEHINIRRVGSPSFEIAEAYGAEFTFIIIDGIPVKIENYRLIGNLPPEEIKSVEIIESPKNSRKYVNDVFGDPMALNDVLFISFINIYTYSKKGLFSVQRTPGMYKGSIAGFMPKREFYAPKHEDITYEDWKEPDLRSVVHWAPSITTDAQGLATVEFYNPDNTGDMLVIVEGITKDGKIGYYDFTYAVEDKLER